MASRFVHPLPLHAPPACLMVLMLVCGRTDAHDERPLHRVTDSIRTAYETLYGTCTGDSGRPVPVRTLLKWKKRLDPWLRSPDYGKSRTRYMEQTGIHEGVTPCDVFLWRERLRRDSISVEQSLDAAREVRRAERAESLRVAAAYAHYPSRPVDFPDVPFGLSRELFSLLFARACSHGLIDMPRYLYISNYRVFGAPFIVAFHFDRRGRYTQYEMESPTYAAARLDETVRPLCMKLIEHFRERLGPPDRRYRIGVFDIVHGRLAPYAVWRRGDTEVCVGIGIYKYQYYANARVSVRLPDTPPRRETAVKP